MLSFTKGFTAGCAFATILGLFISKHYTSLPSSPTADLALQPTSSVNSQPIANTISSNTFTSLSTPTAHTIAETITADEPLSSASCDPATVSALQKIESIIERDPHELMMSLQQDFSIETIDETWAPTYQQQLEDLIRNDDQLRNYLPDDIECRSSKCLMRIRYYSDEERDKLSDQLVNAIQKNTSGIYPEVVISPSEDTQTLEIILNRES